jgi:tetratricopeptide (TPR) repeat protein
MLMLVLPLLLMLQPSPPDASALRAAEQLLRQNRYDEAVAKLETTLQRDPHAGEAVWILLARCYENAGKPEAALRTLQAGLRAHPDSPRLKLNLGEVVFGLKADSQEAGTLLLEAVTALPHDAEARHYYAQWAFLNDKENECAANERAALALPGLNDLALLQMYTLLGLCEDKLDQPGQAESAFQKALAINRRSKPFDPGSAIQFARFLSVSGQDEEARKLVQEIASHAPGFGPVHLEIAKQLEKSGQFAKAADEARKALAGDGNDSLTTRSARSVLAKCLFATGQKKEAEEQRQLIDAESKGKPAN